MDHLLHRRLGGWHLVEIPFADFAYRGGDYQPVGGIDQVLGLNEMWGATPSPCRPGAPPGAFAMDGVELYGKADAALKASVVTDAAVVPVKQGASANLGLTVTTTGSVPLDEPVTVAYETKGGTAKAGTDFTPVSGTYTFPAAPRPAPRTRWPSRRRRSPAPRPRRRSRWR